MVETFTAEVVVAHPQQDYESELARLASAWFETEVHCIALDVSMSTATSGLIARGTFMKDSLPSRSRVATVARWLGLVYGPDQRPATPRLY